MAPPRHWRALLAVAVEGATRRPLQSALLVIGVALGVAVGTAIDIANGSALAAFRRSAEAVGGRSTHRVVGGPTGLDESVYTRLRVELGLRPIAPVVEGPVEIAEVAGAFTLLGVDPFAEVGVRDYLAGTAGAEGGAAIALLVQPGSTLMARDVAERAGLVPGDRLTLDTGNRRVAATLTGYLEPGRQLDRRAVAGILVTDIATAQEVLDSVGRLDRIDIVAPTDGAAADILEAVRAVLPPAADLVSASEERATSESMTEAFRLNLTALSLMALVVGMFLVFNTVRFSVVQRRRTIATLRVMGVTRSEVFGMVLAEAAVLGSVGSVLGLALGVLLARGAVGMVSRTVNDLFATVAVSGAEVSVGTLAKGLALGIVAACAAALVPAAEATSVAPVAAMVRSHAEAAARRSAPRLLALAIAVGAVGMIAIAVPGMRVELGFAGLAAVLVAFALAAPATTLAAMAVVRPVSGRLWGVVGHMAPRSVSRALSRTAVAVAALALAVSVSVGVQIMVDSFRSTVEEWLRVTLQADVFVSRPAVGGPTDSGTIGPAELRRVVAVPGVAGWSTAREVGVRSADLGRVRLVALRSDLAGADREYIDAVGDAAETWEAVRSGALIVSEPFALDRDVTVGDRLELLTDRGPAAFAIAGVYRDYASTEGTLIMDDAVYRAAWDDDQVTSVALEVAPGGDADLVAEAVRGLPGVGRLDARSNAGLRAAALEVFDRAFAITGALRVLAIVVAFMGMLSSLLALQLERRREHGTLRATGMTRRQLGALSMLESGLVGGVAGLLAWPAGLTLALVLIHVINRRSFGWSIDTTVEPGPFVAALALAVASSLLAGVYPAVRLARLPVARALREE